MTSRGNAYVADRRKGNPSTTCEECGSSNCKKRMQDVKCYNCGLIVKEEEEIKLNEM